MSADPVHPIYVNEAFENFWEVTKAQLVFLEMNRDTAFAIFRSGFYQGQSHEMKKPLTCRSCGSDEFEYVTYEA